MNIPDPLGLPGAPLETLSAVRERFPQADSGQPVPEGGQGQPTRLVLVTDRQGHRAEAGYAGLLMLGHAPGWDAVVTAPAFGPRYGGAGVQALADLVNWAEARGLHVYETVLSPSDYERVLAEPEPAEIARLVAASNPADPRIYTRPVTGR